jgi:hypothetical protein
VVHGFNVLFHWNAINTQALQTLKKFYEKGLEEFVSGNFEKAEYFFHEAVVAVPGDGPCKLLIQRCREHLMEEKRGDDVAWDGVLRFSVK